MGIGIGKDCVRCGKQLTVLDEYNWQDDLCKECNEELIKRIDLFKKENKQ